MSFKKPLSIDEQISLLKTRGLVVNPDEETDIATWLKNVNYYKLSGYWLIFEEKNQSGSGRNHKFKQGTTWKDIKHTYIFDQKFRRLLWTSIEKIEISVKAHWSQYLSMKYGAFAHEKRALFNSYIFNDTNDHDSPYKRLVTDYKRSNALYAKHYRENYKNLTTPPIWIVPLMISFGDIVNWTNHLINPKDRTGILDEYGFDEQIMISFLTHLIEVRNICAHNGRLWNRTTKKAFTLPKRLSPVFKYSPQNRADKKIYNTIIMINEVLKTIDPKFPFLLFMRNLIKDNYLIKPYHMGFPKDWETKEPWINLPKYQKSQ
jgi:abortive infection bacteriophage resistance protein